MVLGLGFSLKNSLFFALVFLFVACVKVPDTAVNYGPEESIDDVEKKLVPLSAPDPYTIKTGEFVSMDFLREIDRRPTTVTGQLSQEVTEKTDLGSIFKIKIVTTNNELVDGQWKLSRTEKEYSLNKNPDDISSLAVRPLSESNVYYPCFPTLKDLVTKSKGKVTLHNVKLNQIKFPIPAAVKARPDCGGLNQCIAIDAYDFSVDVVFWNDDKSGDRVNLSCVISNDVPFLAGDLKKCTSQSVFFQNRYIPITSCLVAQDFKFGNP